MSKFHYLSADIGFGASDVSFVFVHTLLLASTFSPLKTSILSGRLEVSTLSSEKCCNMFTLTSKV